MAPTLLFALAARGRFGSSTLAFDLTTYLLLEA